MKIKAKFLLVFFKSISCSVFFSLRITVFCEKNNSSFHYCMCVCLWSDLLLYSICYLTLRLSICIYEELCNRWASCLLNYIQMPIITLCVCVYIYSDSVFVDYLEWNMCVRVPLLSCWILWLVFFFFSLGINEI